MPELTPSALEQICLEFQDRFEWPHSAEAYDVVSMWESRTATFARCRGTPGNHPDVVIKVLADGTADEARHRYEMLCSLADLLTGGADDDGLTVPTPLGWGAKPPVVCMAFVPGADTRDMIDDRRLAMDDLWILLAAAVRVCGRTLGVYHSFAAPSISDDEWSREAALRTIQRTARWTGFSTRAVEEVWPSVSFAPRYDDFGLYNLRLTAEGQFYLLDPPVHRHLDPVHRDIAWFLFGMDAMLDRRLPTRLDAATLDDWQLELRNIFLRAYADTGPISDWCRSDHRLISIYECQRALLSARKRWRQRRLLSSMHHLRTLLRARFGRLPDFVGGNEVWVLN